MTSHVLKDQKCFHPDPLQAVLVSTLDAEVGDCKLEQRADRALTR